MIIDDAYGYMSSRGVTGRHQRLTAQTEKTQGIMNGFTDPKEKDKSRVFILSSFNELSGKQQAKALGQYLVENQDSFPSRLLGDLAYTLDNHRSALPWKTAFAATSLTELVETLTNNKLRPIKSSQKKSLGFVFTGQGAQWHAMGRELIAHCPIFQRSLCLADQHL